MSPENAPETLSYFEAEYALKMHANGYAWPYCIEQARRGLREAPAEIRDVLLHRGPARETGEAKGEPKLKCPSCGGSGRIGHRGAAGSFGYCETECGRCGGTGRDLLKAVLTAEPFQPLADAVAALGQAEKIDNLASQLAASEARCAEMERKLEKNRTDWTKYTDNLQERLVERTTERDAALSRCAELAEKNAALNYDYGSLLAELNKAEARVKELEDATCSPFGWTCPLCFEQFSGAVAWKLLKDHFGVCQSATIRDREAVRDENDRLQSQLAALTGKAGEHFRDATEKVERPRHLDTSWHDADWDCEIRPLAEQERLYALHLERENAELRGEVGKLKDGTLSSLRNIAANTPEVLVGIGWVPREAALDVIKAIRGWYGDAEKALDLAARKAKAGA